MNQADCLPALTELTVQGVQAVHVLVYAYVCMCVHVYVWSGDVGNVNHDTSRSDHSSHD